MKKFSDFIFYRQELRKVIRQKRRQINFQQQLNLAKKATEKIMSWAPIVKANNIALFFSFDGELDTKPLIKQLWNLGKKIYLPVLNPFIPGHLLFLQYHAHTKLIVNHLNIIEPKLNIHNLIPLNNLDVLIIPLVAFDNKGHRLGMGGGFYDRTLKNYRKKDTALIGYAHDCQLVDIFPTGKWDISLSVIATPSRLWIL